MSQPDVKARQHLAVTRPLLRANEDITPYRQVRKHPTGLLLMTILAVDR
jgi:hypothetical protein